MLDVLGSPPYSMGMRQVLTVFLVAAAAYGVLYTVIERRRNVKGPWEVKFGQTTGAPAIVIDQPKLGITNVTLVFEGQRAEDPPAPQQLRFSDARQVPFEVPFGKVVFLDTTFLPGTVTMQLFGHEIELIPRMLVLDHVAHPWRAGEEIRVPVAKPQSPNETPR